MTSQDLQKPKYKIPNKDDDCLSCRIITSLGLICSGIYVGYHGSLKKDKNDINRHYRMVNLRRGSTTIICSGLVTLGFLRFFQLPPFEPKDNF